MASLADADVHLTLSASQSQLRLAQAHRRLLPLRLQVGGLIGGRLDPPLCVLFPGLGRVRQGRQYPTVSQPAGSPPCPGDAVRRPVPTRPASTSCTAFGGSPGWGGMAVLDRSWHGRVLVERVEGLH